MTDGTRIEQARDLAERLGPVLGHVMADPLLLRRALTHRGATGTRPQLSYERLEFLGDRVLSLVIADVLFTRHPDEPEGDLTRRLTALVRRETLAELAEASGLSDEIILGRSEQEQSGATPSILADALEAVIGALYVDGGLEAARAFILRCWSPFLDRVAGPPREPKTRVQEWAQGRGLRLPDYVVLEREGADHAPSFTVELRVQGEEPVRGTGGSRRAAEKEAAMRLLTRLGLGAEP